MGLEISGMGWDWESVICESLIPDSISSLRLGITGTG